MARSGQHGGNVLQMAARVGLDPALVLDFSANINPLGMPARLRAAIPAQLDRLERYPDIDYQQLYAALARHTGCAAEQILAGNGATELIFALTRHLKPRRALLPVPGFAEYRRALQREGCAIIDFPLLESEDFQLTPRLLEALSPDLDCLFLCTPNNPTGQQPGSDLLLQILKRCQQLGIQLIVDESFIDFLPDHRGLQPVQDKYDCLYLLRSLTKFYAIPGLRLGYLLAGDRARLARMKEQQEPWTINALAALAGETVLDDSRYQANTHAWLAREQAYLLAALSALPGIKIWPPAANYLFLRSLDSTLPLQERLLEKGILIRHCANYPGLSSDFYRVAIRTHGENRRLVAALAEVLGHG